MRGPETTDSLQSVWRYESKLEGTINNAGTMELLPSGSERAGGFANSIPIGPDLVIGSHSINSFNLSDDGHGGTNAGLFGSYIEAGVPFDRRVRAPGRRSTGRGRADR